MPATARVRYSAAQRRNRQGVALQARRDGHTLTHIATLLSLPSAQHAGRLVARAQRVEAAAGQRPNRTYDATTVRFGVEIECEGISHRDMAAALLAAGLSCTYGTYTHAVTTGWKIVPDASLVMGGEAVSPILCGEDGHRQVHVAMRALRAAGASVSCRTGMHVHVDMAQFDGVQIADIIETYCDAQDLINPLVSPSRRSNGMCLPLTRSLKDSVTEAFKAGRGRQASEAYNRYHTVNIASYVKYGTVEFRQHQGSLNGTKASAWIKFLLALVVTAAERGPVRANTTQELLNNLRNPMSDNAFSYLSGRALISNPA